MITREQDVPGGLGEAVALAQRTRARVTAIGLWQPPYAAAGVISAVTPMSAEHVIADALEAVARLACRTAGMVPEELEARHVAYPGWCSPAMLDLLRSGQLRVLLAARPPRNPWARRRVARAAEAGASRSSR